MIEIGKKDQERIGFRKLGERDDSVHEIGGSITNEGMKAQGTVHEIGKKNSNIHTIGGGINRTAMQPQGNINAIGNNPLTHNNNNAINQNNNQNNNNLGGGVAPPQQAQPIPTPQPPASPSDDMKGDINAFSSEAHEAVKAVQALGISTAEIVQKELLPRREFTGFDEMTPAADDYPVIDEEGMGENDHSFHIEMTGKNKCKVHEGRVYVANKIASAITIPEQEFSYNNSTRIYIKVSFDSSGDISSATLTTTQSSEGCYALAKFKDGEPIELLQDDLVIEVPPGNQKYQVLSWTESGGSYYWKPDWPRANGDEP